MERTFENPANKHRETVSFADSVGVFCLGMFYLLYKGLWGHVFVWFLIVVVPTVLSGGPLVVLTLPLACIGYAMGIDGILAKRYLNQGWREIDPNSGAAISTIDGVAPVIENQASAEPASEGMKRCPFCAEEVKVAAIKCKHCQSDLPIAKAPAPVSTGSGHIVQYKGKYMVGGYHFDTLEQAQAFLVDRKAPAA